MSSSEAGANDGLTGTCDSSMPSVSCPRTEAIASTEKERSGPWLLIAARETIRAAV